MVVFFEEPENRIDADAGQPLRRTSARLKNIQANISDSIEKKRSAAAAPSPDKRKAAAKKRKIEKLAPMDDVAADVSHTVAANVPTDAVAAADVSAASSGKSMHTLVTETLRNFNKQYLHFVQEEEKRVVKLEAEKKKMKKDSPKSKTKKHSPKAKEKKSSSGEHVKKPSKRPDLKATSQMRKTGTLLNPEKKIGPIPGIDVGHQFFSRSEMVVVGLHHHWLSGIDYIGKTAPKAKRSPNAMDLRGFKLPLTVSIVMSGQYEDDLDNSDDIVYTGQGGNNLLGDKRQISDQKLERGNLGLKHCMELSVPVRVVRGHECQNSYVKKVYTYDGLYKVVKYWAEIGVSGFTVYKFRLQRLEGQPPLTTKEVYFTKGRIPKSLSEIRGLVCEDITGGQEDIPIPVTNLVDDPPISPLDLGFVYIKDMKYSKNISAPTIFPTGCNCRGGCSDSSRCACAKLNGGDFPYVHKDGGRSSIPRLVEAKAVVFECGSNCGCGPACVNRTSQNGYKFRLEIFRTAKKGWGVRSWDYIPSGAPICDYIGLLRRTADLDLAGENSYVFDIDCIQTIHGLDGRESRLKDVTLPSHLKAIGEEATETVPFCIDAAKTGNVARFINHSCQPNLFVQCMLNDHHDLKQARIILVAADNIPPLKELTYDYGYAIDSVMGPDGKIQQLACYCGADECRQRLY